MAHAEQLDFVARVRTMVPCAFAARRVLEIGSLDINGAVRDLFVDCDYTGIDVAPGPGVDLVCQGQDFSDPDASFDSVICCEVMEHNPHWKETFLNMARLCKPGGLVLMTCATTGRQEHGTTRTSPADSPLSIGLGWDYYRNLTARDFRRAVKLHELFDAFRFYRHRTSCDLYFVGFRRNAGLPPKIGYKFAALQQHYLLESVRGALAHIKMRVLIALVGEERYRSGPVRFRFR